MQLTCLAIDDEPLALDLMRSYISKIPFLKLVQTCSSALEALPLLQQQPIDLLFLDIEMPEITGVQFAQSLSHRPAIIFTTAYPQYALDGFTLDAVDYLLKPIPFDRFFKAVNKVYERTQRQPVLPASFLPPTTPPDNEDFIFVKADYKTLRVNLRDILFIEGLKDYVIIHTLTRKIITLLSMNKIMEKLPEQEFTRVHKSYIVALSHIESIEKGRIKIKDQEVPIGDSYRDHFMRGVESKNI
ncbi:LytR/AlgR family response regulator transcription factor [Rufibacter glacialis]|uniref:Response regulator transcription factor n=1 Tax=Rufibacter glacialis TaxID=1259555 RepID=A0A5M8QGS4_9BACT|nr:LytTR family DNA-binding domain-containing protein [Rufibacter glacialis]KAA6434418.1 response regulator transcription factor [Rufibacter glacialis]GGK69399.1 DNA-binding response regulator [Rufibacter glacialis]